MPRWSILLIRTPGQGWLTPALLVALGAAVGASVMRSRRRATRPVSPPATVVSAAANGRPAITTLGRYATRGGGAAIVIAMRPEDVARPVVGYLASGGVRSWTLDGAARRDGMADADDLVQWLEPLERRP